MVSLMNFSFSDFTLKEGSETHPITKNTTKIMLLRFYHSIITKSLVDYSFNALRNKRWALLAGIRKRRTIKKAPYISILKNSQSQTMINRQ